MDRKSSKQMAHIAGEIMALAKKGGPVHAAKEELEAEFRVKLPDLDLSFLDRFDTLMRSYIDNAESLAASVLSQRAK